jgi:hypothetical protein
VTNKDEWYVCSLSFTWRRHLDWCIAD